MRRSILAPLAATAALPMPACSPAESESRLDAIEASPDTTLPLLPSIEAVPDTDLYPVTTPPPSAEESEPSLEPIDTLPKQELPESSASEEPVRDFEFSNVGLCDSLNGPSFAIADIVDEDPTDVEFSHSTISVHTLNESSIDAKTVSVGIRGAGNYTYNVISVDGSTSTIDLTSDEVATVDVYKGEVLIASRQRNGTVWLAMFCTVDMVSDDGASTIQSEDLQA